jgi:uncharacterized protein DUF5074
MRTNKNLIILAVSVSAFLVSCTKNMDQQFKPSATDPLRTTSQGLTRPLLTGPYSNGFFLVNEGWYGHGTGEVNFYSYSTGTLSDSIFGAANPGKNLNPATSTLEFGTVFNGNLYLVSKVGGPLVVTNESTLVESNRIAASSSRDWRAFVGVDSTHGLVSSQTGIYPLTLPALTVGTKLAGSQISGQVGDMIKSGNYIFALSETAGVVVINASTHAIAKTIAGMVVAFARTSDGTVWAAGGTSLLRINPATLDTATLPLPFTANSSWDAWHPGSITASTSENAVFIANNGSFTGGTTIYKYIVGTPSSLSAPFITIASGDALYGAGIGYDASNNTLVVNTVQSGGTTHYSVNDLDIYNAGTGALIKDLGYTGYWFPATPVFH